MHQQESDLENSNNPFAIAILTVLLSLKRKKTDDNNLLHLKIALVRSMYAKGFSAKTTRQLFNFIKVYVNFANPETAIKFDTEIDSITTNTKPMGLEEQILQEKKQEGKVEGKAEGKEEGKEEFVINLLRLTDFTDEKIATLAGVNIVFVQKVKSKIR